MSTWIFERPLVEKYFYGQGSYIYKGNNKITEHRYTYTPAYINTGTNLW